MWPAKHQSEQRQAQLWGRILVDLVCETLPFILNHGQVCGSWGRKQPLGGGIRNRLVHTGDLRQCEVFRGADLSVSLGSSWGNSRGRPLCRRSWLQGWGSLSPQRAELGSGHSSPGSCCSSEPSLSCVQKAGSVKATPTPAG